MTKEIQKEYENLSKKYKLPNYKEINQVFEISTLENADFLLRNIIGKILEKINYYTKFLEEFLQPDAASLSGMHEIRFFTDDEKQKIYVLYKKLMMLGRKSAVIDIIQNQEKEAEFINLSINEWMNIKDELLIFIKKIEECWGKEKNLENDLGYLG